MEQGIRRDNPDDAGLRDYCEREMPAALKAFAAEATHASLPLRDIVVVTPSDPEYALIDDPPSLSWFKSTWALPRSRHDRYRPQFELTRGWLLCEVRAEDGSLSDQWYLTPDVELRQAASDRVASWPAEFYLHLSAAVRGTNAAAPIAVDAGRQLIERILSNALAGAPIVIQVPPRMRLTSASS